MKKDLQLELGSIASGQYYEFQELRKATMNRIRNIVFRLDKGIELRELQAKKGKTDEEAEWLEEYADKKLHKKLKDLEKKKKLKASELEYVDKMFMLLADLEEKEKQYNKLVSSFVEEDIVYTEFSQYVKGLGPMMTAMLLYYFEHCEKATYPSSLWKFSGLYPGAKFIKGESGGFNPKCRMFMWRLGDSFIKQRSERYRPIYDAEKARQLKLMETKAKNAPTRLGHADARARRKMEKFFLVDYYRVCKTLTGDKQSKPYVIEKMGHKHFDDVMVWLKLQKKKAEHKKEKDAA
jgi:hypothetical protein